MNIDDMNREEIKRPVDEVDVEEEVQEDIDPDLKYIKDLNNRMREYISNTDSYLKEIEDMKRDFAASQTQLERTGRELSQLLFEIKQLKGEFNG